jgi:hypothetical protein
MSNISQDFVTSPLPFDDPTTSHLIIYQTEKYIHAAWYNNQEKGIFLSSSIEENKRTVKPKKIMDVEGEIKDIKIIAREDDFVITAVEERGDGEYVRAATGIILPNEMMYDFKPCEKVKVPGKLINAYTIFTEQASMDYIFWKPEKESEQATTRGGSTRGEEVTNQVGRTRGSHCTRLSILNSQKR